jgi:hypothetical protein
MYLTDASRTGGFSVNAIVTSAILNKILIQLSSMVAGIATMLQNKGFSTSDSNQPALVNALSNILTTADQPNPLLSLVYVPTAVLDTTAATGFIMNLGGNLNLSVTGLTPGKVVTFCWQQDLVGSHVITYGGGFFNPGPAQPDPTPNAVSIQSFICLSDGILRPYTPMSVSAD